MTTEKHTYQPAIAHIISTYLDNDILRTSLTLNNFREGPFTPITPGTLWDKDNQDLRIVDLHRLVRRAESILTIETYNISTVPIVSGKSYIFISWWSSDQLAIAQDTSRNWQKQSFLPKDMVLFPVENGQIGREVCDGETFEEAMIIKAGWDHEHCCLCGVRISAYEEEQNVGYTDGKDWVCESCYTTYISSGFGKYLGEELS